MTIELSIILAFSLSSYSEATTYRQMLFKGGRDLP